MTRRIRIQLGGELFEAELNDTNTARAVWEALPLEAVGAYWGKEVYFAVPVQMPEEDPCEVVEPGTVAYWPPGSALCLFWGATPASRGEECRPYSPVNVIGHIEGDLSRLDRLRDLRVVVDRAPRPSHAG